MSRASRRLAGILLIVFPTVICGGVSLLGLLINDPRYQENALRQDLWRAGHAHAGVLLILALVCLRYVDETRLPGWVRGVAPGSRSARCYPLAGRFFPLGSVPGRDLTQRFYLLCLCGRGVADRGASGFRDRPLASTNLNGSSQALERFARYRHAWAVTDAQRLTEHADTSVLPAKTH